VRAVLFDADGVLIDSHRGYRSVWDRWSRLHALDADLVHAATHARRPVDTIAAVAPHLDPHLEYARLAAFVEELPDAFPVFAGTPELLADLPASRWGIVTSGDAGTVCARLIAGAAAVPDVLVDGHAVTRGKPDPEGFLLAAKLLGVAPGDCLVVEDAPAGLEAAVCAGMDRIGITTSHPADDLHAASVVVDSLIEARTHITRWLQGHRS